MSVLAIAEYTQVWANTHDCMEHNALDLILDCIPCYAALQPRFMIRRNNNKMKTRVTQIHDQYNKSWLWAHTLTLLIGWYTCLNAWVWVRTSSIAHHQPSWLAQLIGMPQCQLTSSTRMARQQPVRQSVLPYNPMAEYCSSKQYNGLRQVGR